MVNPVKTMDDLQFLRKLAEMKVLIVDDQRNMVKTLENMLISICAFKRKSESIFRAHDGGEAIKIMLRQPPKMKTYIDLVLLDWNMPRVPGIEVIRAIRGSSHSYISNVPVIMITGEAHRKDVNHAIHEGVDNYMLKPFVVKDLRERMNPLLRAYWSHQPLKRFVNRRKEIRYDVERLRMKMEVEFVDGSKRLANVLTISDHGARIEVDDPAGLKIKSVSFCEHDTVDGYIHKITPVTFSPDEVAGTDRVRVSMSFSKGFDSPETEKQWKTLVEFAKKKDMEFRSQQL